LAELRDSLDFAEGSHRYEGITQAHQTTFDWIFENSELGLVSWLRKGTGVYWIQGKPGSGKSTLMKFLHDDRRTSDILSQWRQGLDHTSAWFFFNERGSYIEKSFEGLFRSVAQQLMSTNEWLAELVLDVYLDRVKHSSKLKQAWNIQDLEYALSQILSQKQQNLEILLFLDALDE
jgi:ABC-type lipoprotein export system ATPase subunit